MTTATAKKVTKTPEPVTAETPPRTSLTPAERTKVRALLDGHFDDSRGAYLDGYSDKRIGEEVGVPWKLVEAVREAAYGPLRADPEADTLLADLKALRGAIDAHAKDCDELEKHLQVLKKDRADLMSEVDDLQKRVAAMHNLRKAA